MIMVPNKLEVFASFPYLVSVVHESSSHFLSGNVSRIYTEAMQKELLFLKDLQVPLRESFRLDQLRQVLPPSGRSLK